MGAAPKTTERRRILLVDDIELNRVLTEAVLRAATYEVDCVGDGASAVAALGHKSYDLVLMDLEMPGLDGHEAAAAIRRDRGAVCLAALSARGGAAARARSAELGMAAHIARPIAPHDLLREIERVFWQAPRVERPDPWQRHLYDEWAGRLGDERMRSFLIGLRTQFRDLLLLLLDVGADIGEIHRRAHDVASTGGMLGFLEVTQCCRAMLEPVQTTDKAAEEFGADARLEVLVETLECAIERIDRHLATSLEGAVAA